MNREKSAKYFEKAEAHEKRNIHLCVSAERKRRITQNKRKCVGYFEEDEAREKRGAEHTLVCEHRPPSSNEGLLKTRRNAQDILRKTRRVRREERSIFVYVSTDRRAATKDYSK